MLKPAQTFLLVATAVTAVTGTARARNDPLLVVVESGPGPGIDADDVRQTIAAELGTAIVAPHDTAAAGTSDVLIVAVDRGEIRMSLRASAVGLVSRTIPAPSERPARLRAIGWLAGNLARDQVSPIVTPLGPAPAVEPSGPVSGTVSDRPATEPPPRPTSFERPPSPAPAEAIAAHAAEASSPPGSRWAITAAGGPTATYYDFWGGNGSMMYESGYQLEVQRQSSPESLIFGAALDAGGSHLLGLAGFVGTSWRHRGWFLEASAGAGVEVTRVSTVTRTAGNSSTTGPIDSTTVTSDAQPVLYARGIGLIGIPISRSFDLVARVGLHLASAGLNADFVTATAGVRFRLP